MATDPTKMRWMEVGDALHLARNQLNQHPEGVAEKAHENGPSTFGSDQPERRSRKCACRCDIDQSCHHRRHREDDGRDEWFRISNLVSPITMPATVACHTVGHAKERTGKH